MSAAAELVRRRCLTHPGREAAARCRECGHDFCRECVTDHEGRMLCGACLASLTAARPERRRRSWLGLARGLRLVAGLLVAWLSFYFLAAMLLRIPSAYHEAVAVAAPASPEGGQ